MEIMENKQDLTESSHLERWNAAGPEKNLIWLDSAIKFSRADKRKVVKKKTIIS
jgi:hypothetical protein